MRKLQRGFTLLEILIVLVILGVIAGLSFPVISDYVEKSRSMEALKVLNTMRGAMIKYRALNGNYTGIGADNWNVLGFNPNATLHGQAPLFSYSFNGSITAGTGNTFTLTAQREPAISNAGNTITFDETGTVVRNGRYQ